MVLIISPACPLAPAEAPVSKDSRDADCDSTERKAAGAKGSAFLQAAKMIIHCRHFVRRMTVVM